MNLPCGFSYSSLFIPRLALTVAIKTEPKTLNIAGAMAWQCTFFRH